MNQTSNQKLNDKTWARWSALFVVAFTMMAAYYVNDIMAPLKSMLEGELHWTSGEVGFFPVEVVYQSDFRSGGVDTCIGKLGVAVGEMREVSADDKVEITGKRTS